VQPRTTKTRTHEEFTPVVSTQVGEGPNARVMLTRRRPSPASRVRFRLASRCAACSFPRVRGLTRGYTASPAPRVNILCHTTSDRSYAAPCSNQYGIVGCSSYEHSPSAEFITIEPSFVRKNRGNDMTREMYDLTALELSQAYRSKKLSPVDVTRSPE